MSRAGINVPQATYYTSPLFANEAKQLSHWLNTDYSLYLGPVNAQGIPILGNGESAICIGCRDLANYPIGLRTVRFAATNCSVTLHAASNGGEVTNSRTATSFEFNITAAQRDNNGYVIQLTGSNSSGTGTVTDLVIECPDFGNRVGVLSPVAAAFYRPSRGGIMRAMDLLASNGGLYPGSGGISITSATAATSTSYVIVFDRHHGYPPGMLGDHHKIALSGLAGALTPDPAGTDTRCSFLTDTAVQVTMTAPTTGAYTGPGPASASLPYRGLNPVSVWADRTPVDRYSYDTPTGTPPEVIVEMANAMEVDLWACHPILADTNYATQFATLVNSQLATGRRAYVELSNECWNFQFAQATQCVEEGVRLGLDPSNIYSAGERYFAQHTVTIGNAWSAVLGDRVSVVLGSQAGDNTSNTHTKTTRLLSWNSTAASVDHVAIAPYFGTRIALQNAKESTPNVVFSGDLVIIPIGSQADLSGPGVGTNRNVGDYISINRPSSFNSLNTGFFRIAQVVSANSILVDHHGGNGGMQAEVITGCEVRSYDYTPAPIEGAGLDAYFAAAAFDIGLMNTVIAEHRTAVSAQQTRLIFYECGPHALALHTGGGVMNPTRARELNQICVDAAIDPRMEVATAATLAGIKANSTNQPDGDPLCWFNAMASNYRYNIFPLPHPPTPWGSWGLAEHYGETNTPKYLAFSTFADANRGGGGGGGGNPTIMLSNTFRNAVLNYRFAGGPTPFVTEAWIEFCYKLPAADGSGGEYATQIPRFRVDHNPGAGRDYFATPASGPIAGGAAAILSTSVIVSPNVVASNTTGPLVGAVLRRSATDTGFMAILPMTPTNLRPVVDQAMRVPAGTFIAAVTTTNSLMIGTGEAARILDSMLRPLDAISWPSQAWLTGMSGRPSNPSGTGAVVLPNTGAYRLQAGDFAPITSPGRLESGRLVRSAGASANEPNPAVGHGVYSAQTGGTLLYYGDFASGQLTLSQGEFLEWATGDLEIGMV